jgi:hypothetical protein
MDDAPTADAQASQEIQMDDAPTADAQASQEIQMDDAPTADAQASPDAQKMELHRYLFEAMLDAAGGSAVFYVATVQEDAVRASDMAMKAAKDMGFDPKHVTSCRQVGLGVPISETRR